MQDKIGAVFACTSSGFFAVTTSLGTETIDSIERLGLATVGCVFLGYISYRMFAKNTALLEKQIEEKNITISAIRKELEIEKKRFNELLDMKTSTHKTGEKDDAS